MPFTPPYEEILRFKLENLIIKDCINEVCKIGQQALTNALIYCDSDVKSDIKVAIEKAKLIKSSPIYT